MATSWSFSKLGDFDKCKKYFWLKHEQKIPEPDRVLRPGQTEFANDRGSRIHDAAEHFVDGTGPFIPELKKFQLEFEHLKHLHTQGRVSLEHEWGMSKDWEITDWKGAWLRLKLDALCFGSPHEAVVIDYKTGKRFGNEVKHMQQVSMYALVSFLRYPELDVVHSELWYTDVDELTTQTFTRDQALRYKRSFNQRGCDITNCTDWPTNANRFSCQWCMYGPEHSGHCSAGVRKA